MLIHQYKLGQPIYPTATIDEELLLRKAAAMADDHDFSVVSPKGNPFTLPRLSQAQLDDPLARGNYLRFPSYGVIADKANFWRDAQPVIPGTKSLIRVDNQYGTKANGSTYDYRSGVYEFGGQVSIEGNAEGSRHFTIFAQLRDIATNKYLYDVEIWRTITIATQGSIPLAIYYRSLRFSHKDTCLAFKLDPLKTMSLVFPAVWHDASSPLSINSCSLWFRQTTRLPSGMD